MSEAITTTVTGITVVVSALVILALIISGLSRIYLYFTRPKQSVAAAAEVDFDPQEEPAEVLAEANDPGCNDEELIAVLTAAVAAYMGGGDPQCNLRVKSFRRIPQGSPEWNRKGRYDLLKSRL